MEAMEGLKTIILRKSDMPADITVELINEFLEFVRNKSIQDGFVNELNWLIHTSPKNCPL